MAAQRYLDTSFGMVVVLAEHGLGRAPAAWRATVQAGPPGLPGIGGAIGASEDSAVDNLWAALEALAVRRDETPADRTGTR